MGIKRVELKFIRSILFFSVGVLSASVVTPIVLSSCAKKQTISVDSVTLDKDKLKLGENATDKLKATVSPENATNKNVTWSSSNESIATVDKKGIVKAVGLGKATITVVTENGGYTASCEIIVTKGITPVTSVRLDRDKLELVEGRVAKLTTTILPENATNKNVTWSSSNESIATVDQYGFVTAKVPGNTEISVTTEDGWHTATCKVTVTKNVIFVEGVTLDKDKLELGENGTAKLTATVFPENATNKNVIWGTSAPSVVTVDQDGNVKVVDEGTAIITVVTENGGYTVSCEVIAKWHVYVEGVELTEHSLNLPFAWEHQLTATVLPENADNQDVTWSSNNPTVATVDKKGIVKVVGLGKATITVITEDGGFKDTCEVEVKEYIPVEGIEITEESLDLPFAWEHQLIANVLPWNANNRGVSWSTNNPTVAIVDPLLGVVKAVGLGKATITVTTWDGLYTATCEVEVKEYVPVEGVELTEHSLDLPFAWEHQFIATVLPWNANNRGVTWTSNNETVLTIDPLLGKAKAVGLGKATITVTTWEGLCTDTCEVEVKEYIPVEGVEIPEELVLPFAWERQLIANVLPWNANNRGVSWSTNNPTVAIVDPLTGVVKAVGLGKATITVTTWDGLYTATCEVEVTP